MAKLGEEAFIKAVARSIYYDRYLTICENFINWKYINKSTKEKSLKFMKRLLSYDVGTHNKFSGVLDDADQAEDKCPPDRHDPSGTAPLHCILPST